MPHIWIHFFNPIASFQATSWVCMTQGKFAVTFLHGLSFPNLPLFNILVLISRHGIVLHHSCYSRHGSNLCVLYVFLYPFEIYAVCFWATCMCMYQNIKVHAYTIAFEIYAMSFWVICMCMDHTRYSITNMLSLECISCIYNRFKSSTCIKEIGLCHPHSTNDMLHIWIHFSLSKSFFSNYMHGYAWHKVNLKLPFWMGLVSHICPCSIFWSWFLSVVIVLHHSCSSRDRCKPCVLYVS